MRIQVEGERDVAARVRECDAIEGVIPDVM